MRSGTKAVLIVGGLWAGLAGAAYLAHRSNAERDRLRPMVLAVSEATEQSYLVFAHTDGNRLTGFDLEQPGPRFPDCSLPVQSEEGKPETCMDTTGARWDISR